MGYCDRFKRNAHIYIYIFFFLCGFSFTNIHESQKCICHKSKHTALACCQKRQYFKQLEKHDYWGSPKDLYMNQYYLKSLLIIFTYIENKSFCHYTDGVTVYVTAKKLSEAVEILLEVASWKLSGLQSW